MGRLRMRVLAIDSSGMKAAIAIVEDDLTIAEYTVNYKKTFADLAADD